MRLLDPGRSVARVSVIALTLDRPAEGIEYPPGDDSRRFTAGGGKMSYAGILETPES